MQVTIDIESEEPLFGQLVGQIKKAVQAGQLLPEQALPSIRQLASDLSLNNKTVAKAYKLLERDGVIQTKGYRGTFVHPNALKNCTIDLPALVQAKLEDAVRAARAAGATDSEIRIAFSQVMQTQNMGETK
ncbi:GntR family transcriptional regulator [uncultured Maritalea sp.]|uniref:GntR family transcriptional regulator n=1 Tax=uncultured Maritalea sp. TaxID=757249 RepID=UPI00260D267F|nr:GntR family transcriptional regulator [uncultured Maritalea sp.]